VAETAAASAVKVAVVEPAGMLTEAGTLTDALLLARLAVAPPEGAARLKWTVQLSDPAPDREALLHVRLLTCDDPAVAAELTVRPPQPERAMHDAANAQSRAKK
jgi:hypothetical protein